MRRLIAGCLFALVSFSHPALADTAGRPIQLADHMNGAPAPDHALRHIVPGDRRGGRSVRDVIRIDIE